MTDQTRPHAAGYTAALQNDGATTAPYGYPPDGPGYPYGGGPGYPYAVQPIPHSSYYYNNQNPDTYYEPYIYETNRNSPVRRGLSVFFACFVFFIVIILMMVVVIQPKQTEFNLESFSVSQLNLSSSSSQISGVWEAQLTSVNPNMRMDVLFNSITAAVYYNRTILADNALRPYILEPKMAYNIAAELAASSKFVASSVVKGMEEEKAKGSIKFLLHVEGLMQFQSDSWKSKPAKIDVFCKNLIVRIASNSSNGTMTDGPKGCYVSPH